MKHRTIDPVALRDALPSEMLRAGRWLLWKEVKVKGEPKPKKIPFYVDGKPRSGTLDSPADVARLASFDDACVAFAADRYAGLGFALGDGWQGVDLDKHRDPGSGRLSELAESVVNEARAYTEASPSGHGLHILGFGEKFDAIASSATNCGIEAYASGRFFTVTGQPLQDTDALADLRPVVERLRAQYVRINGADPGQQPTGGTEADRIPEGQRNDYLFRLACRLRRSGLSAEATPAALLAENRRCNPPLSDDEVRAIVRSAFTGATQAPVDDTELDAEDLLVAQFRPLRALVPDIVVDGLTILAAKPKLGKTWFAVAFALANANGSEFLRHRIEASAALLVALEDSDRRLQARLRKLVPILGSPQRGTLRIRHAWPRGVEGAVKLDAYLGENPAVRLAIFDTYRGLALRRGRGDLVAEDYEIVVAYQRVAHARGVALILVMHERKSIEGGDWIDAIAGTHGLTAAADALLVLRRARGEDTATLSVTGRDIERDGELGLRFDRDHGLWTVEGTAAEVMARAERQEVLHALRVADAPLTQKEIAEAIERTHGRRRTRQNTWKLINGMVRDGLIVAAAGGGYVPPLQ